MLKQYFINKFLRSLEKIEYGNLTLVTPDNNTYNFHGSDDIYVSLYINSWNAIINIAAKGDIGFAESYRDGLLEADNIIDLCMLAMKNESVLEKYIYGNSISNFCSQIAYYLKSNTLKGSRKNINAHYDISNDFYSIWLDNSMTYSSAIFNHDNENLIQAQNNKYNRILDVLGNPTGSLLEVGCGWGGFADHAITNNKDLDIKGITISEEQYKFAKSRLGNNANIVLEDYRHQVGKYNNIVSIEMFEAVGEKFWPIYFQKLSSLLDNNGKAVIQTITIDNKYFDRYRKTGDAVRTFIFPGGMLPSKERFNTEINKANLNLQGIYEFGQDYALTLKHWLNSFEENINKIAKMGFDSKFIRLWRFYLAVCIASFTVGRTNVIQAEIVHA